MHQCTLIKSNNLWNGGEERHEGCDKTNKLVEQHMYDLGSFMFIQ